MCKLGKMWKWTFCRLLWKQHFSRKLQHLIFFNNYDPLFVVFNIFLDFLINVNICVKHFWKSCFSILLRILAFFSFRSFFKCIYFSILGCKCRKNLLIQLREGLNYKNIHSKVFCYFFTLIITNHATVPLRWPHTNWISDV